MAAGFPAWAVEVLIHYLAVDTEGVPIRGAVGCRFPLGFARPERRYRVGRGSPELGVRCDPSGQALGMSQGADVLTLGHVAATLSHADLRKRPWGEAWEIPRFLAGRKRAMRLRAWLGTLLCLAGVMTAGGRSWAQDVPAGGEGDAPPPPRRVGEGR